MTNTISTAEFAAALHTDPKTVRKYLRSVTPKDEQPGKGSRWALPGTKTAITKHTKQFAAWTEQEAKRNADRLAAKAQDAAAKVEALTEDSDPEPTDAELEVIETDEDTDQD